MSPKTSQFIILPNEVIYIIFNFLSNHDILHTFRKLNRRYANLVRFYIKRFQLTDVCQEDQQELKWICKTIETLKIDQYYIHLLNDSDNKEGQTSSSIIKNVSPRNGKSLWRYAIKKLTTPFQSCVHRTNSRANYQFPELHSLELVNVSDWNKIISIMNLKSLSLWFDSHDICYFDEQKLIPQTIIRFSANAILHSNCFHVNLINLNIYIRTMADLLEIIIRTPNVQHLFVTFADNFDSQYYLKNSQPDSFKKMTTNFHRLNNLNCLSFNTKQSNYTKSNEHFPFNQIQYFIDRYCPNETILKKVILKLEYIIYDNNMWLTIKHYKNIFHCFNFYGSFILEEKVSDIMKILSNTDQFDFHVEDGDTKHAQARFIHVYSRPFTFNKLHGFISYSELNSQCSFSTIHHLYFTRTRLARPISFESLSKRMPNLVSIDCNFTFALGYHTNIPQIIVDNEIFYHVRFLRFISHCWSVNCSCRGFLSRLLNRMPYLQYLTTSEVDFISAQHPLPPIKQLDMRQCHFQFIENLEQHLPYLSTLLLGYVTAYQGQLSQFLSSLFIGILPLRMVSFRLGSECGNDRTLDEQLAKETLIRVQNINNRLRHLKLDFGCGRADFSLRNL